MRAPSLAIALIAGSVVASHAGEKRELDSHEHGHVKLEIAIEGDAVDMALEAPGENIVGFEHEATTDEQKAKVETERKRLADAAALFTMPDAAGCSVKSSGVELHMEGEHAAFEASYAYTCTNVSALNSIETKLFALYPSIEEIDVDYATPAGQGSAELEAGAAVLTLPSTS